MNRLLVLGYAFPPCNVSGTHRTLAFVKYLAREGWHCTVVCARNPVDPERDRSLLSQVPAGTEVVRTIDLNLPALRERLRRRPSAEWRDAGVSTGGSIGSLTGVVMRYLKRYVAVRLRVPDHYLGWYPHTLLAGWRILKSRRFDAVYSTAPPFTGHMVARRLARAFSVPWIADFRDPWVSNPFADIPFDRLRAWNARAEAETVRDAGAIVCVVETMREDFLHRYPERHAEDIVTIPNGFDPEAFEDLWAGSHGIGPPAERNGTLTILHTGHVYGPRRIEPLLAALTEWRRIDPELTESVRVRLVGGSSEYVESLRATIQRYQLHACVAAEPEVSHREALRRQSRASVLMLVGFSGPHAQYQMSGKIFEYLAIGRPILALAPPSCPVGDVLRGAGAHHWIVSPNDELGLLSALRAIGGEWQSGRLSGLRSSARIDAYDRRAQTRRLAEILDRLIARRPPDR